MYNLIIKQPIGKAPASSNSSSTLLNVGLGLGLGLDLPDGDELKQSMNNLNGYE